MAIAGLILGIVGAIAGFLGSGVVLFISGLGPFADMKEVGSIAGAILRPFFDMETALAIRMAGFAALVFAIAGLTGAALTMARAKTAALFMLVSALGGFIAISGFFALATVLLTIAAFLAFLSRKRVGDAS